MSHRQTGTVSGAQHEGLGSLYQERRLNWIALCADDAPPAEEDGARNGNADQDGINIANFWESRDAPKEVDGGRDDGSGGDEETNLCLF